MASKFALALSIVCARAAAAATATASARCAEGESECATELQETSSLLQTKQQGRLGDSVVASPSPAPGCHDNPNFSFFGFTCKAIAWANKEKKWIRVCSFPRVRWSCPAACGDCPDPPKVRDWVPLHHLNRNGVLIDGVWIDVGFGSAAQPQIVSLILDTGSSTLAVPPPYRVPCDLCPAHFGNETCQFLQCPPDTFYPHCVAGGFDPTTAGRTLKPLSSNDPVCLTGAAPGTDFCAVAKEYRFGLAKPYKLSADCLQGYSGYLATESILLGTSQNEVPIVVINHLQQGFQEPPASGIFGVAFAQLNDNPGNFEDILTGGGFHTQQPSALTTFLEGNGLKDEISLCMGTPFEPGVLVLGESDPQYRTGDFQSVPMNAAEGFYGISVKVATVNGQSEPFPVALKIWSGAVVDSSIASLQLPFGVYHSLNGLYAPTSEGACNLSIELANGVMLKVPDVMFSFAKRCFFTSFVQESSDVGRLGYAVLRNYYTKFDRANKEFGFAPGSAKCGVAQLPASRLQAFPKVTLGEPPSAGK